MRAKKNSHAQPSSGGARGFLSSPATPLLDALTLLVWDCADIHSKV